MKKKSTKFGKMLITSLVSIVLCVFMLAGTTWAWFTDSVTNAGNKIQAGTLDVSLLAAKSDGAGGYGTLSDVSESAEPIFKGENWEPGYSTGVKLAVKNNGTLSLKYKLTFGNLSATKGIEEVLEVAVDGTSVGTLSEFVSGAAFLEGALAGGETSAEKTVVVSMQTSAGNAYQGAAATFDIRLVATQTAEEAVYPSVPNAIQTTVSGTAVAAQETVLTGAGNKVKATIPASAIAEDTEVELSVSTTKAASNSVTYDISLTDAQGAALTLGAKVGIELEVGKGLDNVTVKHNGVPMAETDYSYAPDTGILTIYTDTFSPFEVTYELAAVVASIGDKGYFFLEDAFAAAKQDEVIYLWQDAALTADVETGAQIRIPSNAAVTFDLAGKKLTSTYTGISVANYGTLTVNDSVGNGILHNTSAEVGDNYSHDAVRNFGTLTINGGTFGDSDTDKTNANTEHRGAAVRNMPGAVCEINGGFFTCGDNYYTWGDTTSFSYAIRSSGELTINDATLYGAMNGGVAADAGNITINGGNFSVTGAKSFHVLATNKNVGTITVTGGIFTKSGNNNFVFGGFSGMPSWDASLDLEGNGYTIAGGTFDQNGTVKTYRRVSNAEEFTSAVSVANADDVIVLAGKIELTSQVAVSKPLSFVGLAGSGISGAPIRVAENVSASFRNVAFSSPKNANNNASCVYGSGLAKLVFEGCTFTDTQWDSIQFIPAAGAEIVIDGCTFTNSVEGYRFIHIEASLNSNADVKVTITNNTFGSSEKTTMSIIDIDYINFAGITANGNTFADEKGDIYICGASVARTITSAEAYVMFKAQV